MSIQSILHPFDRDTGTIFLTGTGVVCYRVASRLIKAGYSQLRIGVEDVDSDTLTEFKNKGAEVVKFSWEDESTYADALNGVKTIFCELPYHEGIADHFPTFFNTCRASRVRYFVKLSYYHALTSTRAHVMVGFHVALPEENPFQRIPLMKAHGDFDEMLIKNRSMDYTLLFCTHKMSDPLVYHGRSLHNDDSPKIYGASHGNGVNYISPNDIASAAVRVLVSPRDHARAGYSLTGAPLTDDNVAEILSKHLAKKVTYVDLTDEEFEEEQKKDGEPEWLVEDLVPIEKLKSSGLEIGFLSKDFEKLCGRKAESFQEYLQQKEDMTPKESWVASTTVEQLQ